MIEIKNLRKIYRPQVEDQEAFEVKALDGVDLRIECGEFVAIMGPSGSGKSTLMQILGLLDRPTSGTYFLDGQDISHLSDDDLADLRSKKVGFIFQFFNLLARTTCVDNVALPMLYAREGQSKEAIRDRAIHLLEQMGLTERLAHRPHQLSGGQQQRVAIARALANQPQLIFADEPTGNISTEQSREILGLLDDLNKDGVTIVLVTHEMEVAKRARRLITIRDGKVASDEEVRKEQASSAARGNAQPLHRTTKAFVHPAGGSALEGASEQRNRWPRTEAIRRLWDNTKMASRALTLNKMRTTLATLGVVIGITSVVCMVAIGQGAKQAVREQLASLGTNILSIRSVNPNSARGGSDRGRRFTVQDYEDLGSLVGKEGGIKDIDAQVYGNVIIAAGEKNATSEIVGAFTSSESMQNYRPIAGRFFTEEENQTRAKVALIGQTVLENLYPKGTNPIGSTIRVNRIEFTVIGVLPAKGATSFKDRDDIVLMPIHTAMQRVLGRRTVQYLGVELARPEDASIATEKIAALLRERSNLREGQPDNFEIRNLNDIQEIYNQTTGIISSMLAAIAAISLIVGGIGIMNVMLVAVKERTREVGLRKAIGARGRDILAQFLTESIMIGLFGGLIGVLGGYGFSVLISRFVGWPTIVSPLAVVVAFAFSFLVGIFFGLWPAQQASRLSPIEALRYE